MRSLLGVGIVLLAFVAGRADDSDKKPDTPKAQFDALQKEYREAQQAFFKALQKIEDPEEQRKVMKQEAPKLEKLLARFIEQYGLSEYDAGVLTADRDLASFYEAVASEVDPKQASNWISGDLRALLNESGTDISDSKVEPEHMKELIELVATGKVSRSAARTALGKVFETGDSPSAVVEREGLASVGSDELSGVVDEAISANPVEAERVRGGDKKVVGFLVGQVMKATRGNADGGRVRELLMEKLGS